MSTVVRFRSRKKQTIHFAGAGICLIRTPEGSIIFDETDFDTVSQFTWHTAKRGNTAYARAGSRDRAGKQITISMHRLIMGCSSAEQIDHANRNGLDNRRSNLRTCSITENLANAMTKRGPSGFRGVQKHGERWVVRIKNKGKKHQLGVFSSKEEAAKAYDQAAVALWGEFALTNFKAT